MPKPATRTCKSNIKTQTSNISEASPSDVVSIDAIVAAAYEVISGPAGRKRDWDRERSLFLSGARLIPTAVEAGRNDVALAPQMLDVEGYIERVEPLIEKKGFYEKEIARRVEQFGQIAHVWSTYESRHDPGDPTPFMRGINSIQLFNDGKRWWIVSIYWQQESAKHPLPKKYL
jgi:hypothetical protein